jgi:hypothetical protein
MNTASTEDRVSQDIEHARSEFTEHQIVKSGEGRWLVKKPGTGIFWFEVIILAGGKI